ALSLLSLVLSLLLLFFFTATATPEISTLSLHDALPICFAFRLGRGSGVDLGSGQVPGTRPSSSPRSPGAATPHPDPTPAQTRSRSEEHTSELQSLTNLVCRLLLEKKKTTTTSPRTHLHN